MKYRSEIDGLRALAVLAVVLFHFDFFSVTGGFYGVDVFFVISGYLISSLLFAEIDSTGSLSISQFYLRRTRRILPALLVFCLISYIFFIAFIQKIQSPFPHYGESLVAALFSASNIYFWLHSGYFALDAWAEPLLHTWSLGVEEQFYIVIPLFLLGLSWYQHKKEQKEYWLVFFVLTLLSFAFCRWGRGMVGGDFIFYMLPSRMWELLVGVLVALFLRRYDLLDSKNNLINNIIAIVSVGIMVFCFYNYQETTRIAEKALIITSAAALFLIFANKRTFTGKIFGSPPFRFIGKISYSWYLWHWPMVTLSIMIPVKFPGINTVFMQIGLFTASLLLAYLSWKYVESPFRKKQSWRSCVKPLAPLFGLLLLLGVGNSLEVFGSSPYSFNRVKINGATLQTVNRTKAGKLGLKTGNPAFVLVGNSHAQSVAPVINALAEEYNTTGIFFWERMLSLLNMQMTEDDTPLTDVKKALIAYLNEHHIKKILVVARLDIVWEYAYEGKLLYKGEPLLNEAIESTYLKELISLLSQLATDKREIWIMEQVPHAKVNPIIAVRVTRDYSEPDRLEKHNELLREAVKTVDHPNIHILNPHKYFAKDGRIYFTSKNELLYYDDDHLSVEGAFSLANLFRPFFDKALSADNSIAVSQ